jgi:hypothetical protein
LISDIRCALRALSRTPGFGLTVVLTLGLGIGNGLLWRPLPDPDRLAVPYARATDHGGYGDHSWSDYRDLRSGTAGVFADLIACFPTPLSLVARVGRVSTR